LLLYSPAATVEKNIYFSFVPASLTSMSSAQHTVIVIDDIDKETLKNLVGAPNSANQDAVSNCIDDDTEMQSSGGHHSESAKIVVISLCDDENDERPNCSVDNSNVDQQPGKNCALGRKRAEQGKEPNTNSRRRLVSAEGNTLRESLRSSVSASIVPLLPTSAEYTEVQQFFANTRRGYVIHSIDRVVDRRREDAYQRRKDALLASGVEFSEARYFFGGAACGGLVAAILAHGFAVAALAAHPRASFSESAAGVDPYPAPHQRMLVFDVLAIDAAQVSAQVAPVDPAGSAGNSNPQPARAHNLQLTPWSVMHATVHTRGYAASQRWRK
jgi:hypothetical protein